MSLALQIAVLVATVYAFVHAALQRPDAYTAAEKLTKPVWLVILGSVCCWRWCSGSPGGDRGGRRRRLSRRRPAQDPGNPGQVPLVACAQFCRHDGGRNRDRPPGAGRISRPSARPPYVDHVSGRNGATCPATACTRRMPQAPAAVQVGTVRKPVRRRRC